MVRARQGRIVVPLLGVFTGLGVLVAAVSLTFLVQEQELRQKKERELAFAQAEKEDLEQQLTEVREAKQHVEGELSRTKTQLDQQAQELAEERQAKETLAKSVEERQREIDRLSRDLEQIRSERTTWAEQVSQLKGQQETLQAHVSDLEQAKGELEQKVLELSGQPPVELDRVVVTPTSSGEASLAQADAALVSSLQGQVLVVNREYDFVVMSLGKNHGLEIGQEFQIVRGEEVVGRVKVEKLYDELSAAAILPESNKDAIREGDLVKAI